MSVIEGPWTAAGKNPGTPPTAEYLAERERLGIPSRPWTRDTPRVVRGKALQKHDDPYQKARKRRLERNPDPFGRATSRNAERGLDACCCPCHWWPAVDEAVSCCANRGMRWVGDGYAPWHTGDDA